MLGVKVWVLLLLEPETQEKKIPKNPDSNKHESRPNALKLTIT